MEESVCTYVSKDNFDQLQRSNVVSTLIHLETFNIQDAIGCIHTSPCMKLYTETFRFQKKHPEAVCSLFSSINNTHFPSLLCFRAEHRLVVYEFKSCSRFTFTFSTPPASKSPAPIMDLGAQDQQKNPKSEGLQWDLRILELDLRFRGGLGLNPIGLENFRGGLSSSPPLHLKSNSKILKSNWT